ESDRLFFPRDAGKAGGLDCLPSERFVDLARQAADADGTDPCLAVEGGQSTEEEGEEWVEALTLNGVLVHLFRELPRRARVASRRCVGLPLRIQARVRSRAVHRRGGD